MSAPFEIKNFRAIGSGNVSAFFTVAFAKLELNDCKLVQGRDGLFFAPPSRSYEKNGETKYSNIFYITDEGLRQQIQAVAIDELSKQQQQNNQGGGGWSEPTFNPDEDIPFAMPQCYRDLTF